MSDFNIGGIVSFVACSIAIALYSRNKLPLTVPPDLPLNDNQLSTQPSTIILNDNQLSSQALCDALYSASFTHGVGLLFKNLESAGLVLRLIRSIDSRLKEYDARIDAFYDMLLKIEQSGFAKSGFQNTKVLVIEGLSDSGKSTLATSLCNYREAGIVNPFKCSLASIPAEILAVKDVFYTMPEPVVKAFEFATCYFIAYKISTSGLPMVVVERFYHAACVHTVCTDAGSGHDVETLPQPAFLWPSDLPVPDLVIYLALSADLRARRRRYFY